MRCYANETGAYNCDFSHLKTVMKDLFVKEEVVSGYIQALSHLISFQRLVSRTTKDLWKGLFVKEPSAVLQVKKKQR